MKQYLLSVIHDWDVPAPSSDEMQQAFEAVAAFNDDLETSGAWVFAGGLQHPASATVVKVDGDHVLTTDGPYLETKEHLGGFWVIKCADLDAALEWAAKGSKACGGPVEVRPFQDDAEE